MSKSQMTTLSNLIIHLNLWSKNPELDLSYVLLFRVIADVTGSNKVIQGRVLLNKIIVLRLVSYPICNFITQISLPEFI